MSAAAALPRPSEAPVMDGDGNLFGTTSIGGATNNGVVYELVND